MGQQTFEMSSLQRAQCQCSDTGFSNDKNVLYNAYTGKIYKSENVVTGGPYKFIGCGAHTRYRDDLVGFQGVPGNSVTPMLHLYWFSCASTDGWTDQIMREWEPYS
jgi:hypothetical protein